MIRRSAILLLAVFAAGCSSLWNWGNQGALIGGMVEVLRPIGVTADSLECQMIGNTRTGYCLLDTTPQMVTTLATTLGLDYRVANPDDPLTLPPIVDAGKAGCLSPQVFGNVRGLPAYWLGGRPKQLELSGGGQFEYLMLIFNPTSKRSCIQVSYAYG
jgi:hypothetical protein